MIPATPARLRTLWDEMQTHGYDTLLVYGVGALAQYGAYTFVTGDLPGNKGGYAVVTGGADPYIVPGARVAVASSRRAQLERLVDSFEGVVGIAAGPQGLPAGDVAFLNSVWGGRIGDASTLVDRLRRNATVRSEAELRATAREIERALAAVEHDSSIGHTELDIAARIRAQLTLAGAQIDIVQVSAGDFSGSPSSNRPVLDGDLVTVFAEATRPDGQWVELGAIYLAGNVSAHRVAAAEGLIKALRTGTRSVVPDASPGSIWQAMREVSETIGPATIGWGHGTGTDEGPLLIGPGNDGVIADRDVLCIHPSASREDVGGIAVANTLIAGVGPISEFPFGLRRIERRP